MMILNERQYAEDLYLCKNTDIKSLIKKIEYVTKYQLYVLDYNDADNYRQAVQWLKNNHNNFDENYYSNLISDAISKAHKESFYIIDNIKITQKELDIISSLDNLRAEKALFVLLCMAKQQQSSRGFTNGLVQYTITDLFKIARISVPAEDREYILHEIVKQGLLGYPKKNDTKCLIVNFLDDINDAVLTLDEIDCQELAYVYLNWKNKGKGYGRCELCGKLMKKSSKTPQRFCEDCSHIIGNVSDNTKVIKCVDCGKIVYIDNLNNTKTCRCEECQDRANTQSNKDKCRKYRESKKTTP